MASLARYESFLVNNVSTISTLESSLRSITWFLPGKFKDADLASETLSALLNLVSMYHDTLLSRIVRSNPKYKPLIPSSLHTRYTRAWLDRDSRYKWAARLLEVLRSIELVIEMTLRRNVSSRNRWRGIVLLEFIKAALRFILLRETKRPIISPPIPERDFDPALLLSSDTSTSKPVHSSSSSSPPATPEHLKNNHVPLNSKPHPLLTPPPSSRSDSSVEEFLLPKALTKSCVKPSISLMTALQWPQDWLAEILYVLRPLVYASLLTSDRRSNRPLMTALAMELISRNLRRNPPVSATLERTEYARRDRGIFWYLLRGTVWQNYTRPKLEHFIDASSSTPLFGVIAAFAKDWIPLIDEYYYYTAP